MRVIALLGVAVFAVVSPAPATAAPAVVHVAMANYAFAPATVTVTAGATVVWTNTDQAPHDVTTTSAPVAIHSQTLTKGQSWSYTFTTPGTYQYICSVHPDMRATVIVRAASSPPASTHGAATSAPPAARTGSIAPVPTATTPRVRHTPTAHRDAQPPPASEPTVALASTTPVQAAPSLRPLLLVAGLVAAVATLCLLLLAAAPDARQSGV
jgi:plastocyanin